MGSYKWQVLSWWCWEARDRKLYFVMKLVEKSNDRDNTFIGGGRNDRWHTSGIAIECSTTLFPVWWWYFRQNEPTTRNFDRGQRITNVLTDRVHTPCKDRSRPQHLDWNIYDTKVVSLRASFRLDVRRDVRKLIVLIDNTSETTVCFARHILWDKGATKWAGSSASTALLRPWPFAMCKHCASYRAYDVGWS